MRTPATAVTTVSARPPAQARRADSIPGSGPGIGTSGIANTGNARVGGGKCPWRGPMRSRSATARFAMAARSHVDGGDGTERSSSPSARMTRSMRTTTGTEKPVKAFGAKAFWRVLQAERTQACERSESPDTKRVERRVRAPRSARSPTAFAVSVPGCPTSPRAALRPRRARSVRRATGRCAARPAAPSAGARPGAGRLQHHWLLPYPCAPACLVDRSGRRPVPQGLTPGQRRGQTGMSGTVAARRTHLLGFV